MSSVIRVVVAAVNGIRYVAISKGCAPGSKVYVRDVSFMGFPTFHIYVPGVTAQERLTREVLDLVGQVRASEVREVLLNLKGISNKRMSVHCALWNSTQRSRSTWQK